MVAEVSKYSRFRVSASLVMSGARTCQTGVGCSQAAAPPGLHGGTQIGAVEEAYDGRGGMVCRTTWVLLTVTRADQSTHSNTFSSADIHQL